MIRVYSPAALPRDGARAVKSLMQHSETRPLRVSSHRRVALATRRGLVVIFFLTRMNISCRVEQLADSKQKRLPIHLPILSIDSRARIQQQKHLYVYDIAHSWTRSNTRLDHTYTGHVVSPPSVIF